MSNADQLFELGQTVATPGALEALAASGETALKFLLWHACGNWGECSGHDSQAHDDAVNDHLRVFSVYRTALGVKLWVITEHDRSSTCVLLREEY